MPDDKPLEERALRQLGPHQYAIEGNGVDHAGEPNVWHVDLAAKPAAECDCPAFVSSQEDPPICKHIPYLRRVETHLQAALYDRIFGRDE